MGWLPDQPSTYVYARLEIRSLALSPIEIDEIVGLVADEADFKGERLRRRRADAPVLDPLPPPGRMPVRINRWIVRSPLAKRASVDEHLRALLRRTSAVAPAIKALRGNGCAVVVFLGIEYRGDHQSVGFVLDAATIEGLAALGADLDVDQFWFDRPE